MPFYFNDNIKIETGLCLYIQNTVGHDNCPERRKSGIYG